MSGSCGDCDKQIEFSECNIEKEKVESGTAVYLVCPWCDERKLITVVSHN